MICLVGFIDITHLSGVEAQPGNQLSDLESDRGSSDSPNGKQRKQRRVSETSVSSLACSLYPVT